MWNLQKLSNIGNFVLIMFTVIGGYIAVDNHYAKAAEVKKLELRIEQKIIMDRQDRVQERIWKFEDKYPDIEKAPVERKREYKQLQKENIELDESLNIIQQNMEKTK